MDMSVQIRFICSWKMCVREVFMCQAAQLLTAVQPPEDPSLDTIWSYNGHMFITMPPIYQKTEIMYMNEGHSVTR